MFVQGTKITTIEIASELAVVQEAVRVLEEHHSRKITAQRWVCETCGMIHTGVAPRACASCGSDRSIVQLADFRTEMYSRW